jgi:ATPase subunit of ABC transporter with duplicated ATPase domains
MTDDSTNGQEDDETSETQAPDEEESDSEKGSSSSSSSSSRSSTFWGIVDRINPRQALSYLFGRKVSIFGPSRAGKTTLFKFIAQRVLPEFEQKSMNTPYFEWKRGVPLSYKLHDGHTAKFWLKYVEDSAGDSETDLILKET